MINLLVTAAIIQKGDRILIAQRLAGGKLANKWEFPGGKVEAGEEPESALKREIMEELGFEIEVGDIAAVITEKEEERNIILLYYYCYPLAGSPRALDCQDYRWVRIPDLKAFDFAPADAKMVNKLCKNYMEKKVFVLPG
ncbi:MAG: (deoxy)nucleoside triphosphate pyrophosphohydrolase [Bacillota bacterium]|uniref:8-oxo-dGTP diphosphatase n=1 Tax=Thermanaerosceptrum fracticalcis TaxID=1712410 RepID=A0A7G6DZ27_THEFR|nr:(deoxy)nucleoside triphosphate pyrophosphohydrolase [Thermanaerosceptrum fracticalcis]QNB45081.1 NUDIX domain-containing protein [Thermanaerosceptrum fracticalcis]